MFDVLNTDYSPVLKKWIKIYLDKDSTISGDDGKFIFNHITKGNHSITITLPNYEPFVKDIDVANDTSVVIYIYGIKDNYFPIQASSQKKFKYFSSYGGGYPGKDSGAATWLLSTAKQAGNSIVYEVNEKIIFIHKTFSALF